MAGKRKQKTHPQNKIRKQNFRFNYRETILKAKRAATDLYKPPTKPQYGEWQLMFNVLILTLCALVISLAGIAWFILGILGVMEIFNSIMMLVFGIMSGMIFISVCPASWEIIKEIARRCFSKKN